MNWLANCTPPSCIQVNQISMAMAINPNFKVVKKIPCVRHIQVLRMVLSDVTQAVAGKTIAESTKINQLQMDGTSHKGTEIVNIFFSILNKDNQLKTICLSILLIGGHMEWNINSDKIIINWLANRTRSSCIRVNLLSMELDINPNFEVV